MKTKTMWHRLLGKLLELLLTPVGITVMTDSEVMSEPPRADILLLRREDVHWTAAQMALLPDGIRDSQAQMVLIEFKFSESLTLRRLMKVIGYEVFYKQSQQLPDEAVQSFIVSAKTPSVKFLQRMGYHQTTQTGVYTSQNVLLANIPLLILNQLPDSPHNAYLKCFASRKVEREKAFERLAEMGFKQVGQNVWGYLMGLRQTLKVKGDVSEMKIEITAEDVMELGEGLRAKLLETIPVEERLRGLTPEEVLSLYRPEEVLSRYEPEERLVGLKPEERLVGMEPYLAEREKKVLLQTLKRSLQIRFGVDEAGWGGYELRLQKLEFASLEHLSETVLLVNSEAEFAQAVNDLETQA